VRTQKTISIVSLVMRTIPATGYCVFMLSQPVKILMKSLKAGHGYPAIIYLLKCNLAMTADLGIFYIFLGVIFALFCSSIAREKGYSDAVWGLIGFFFNFIALIAIAGMPDLIARKYLRRLAEALPQVETKGPKFDSSITT